MSDAITAEQLKLLISYSLGQLTSYGLHTTEEDIVRHVETYSASQGLQVKVTPEEVQEVLDELVRLKAVRHAVDDLPYA